MKSPMKLGSWVGGLLLALLTAGIAVAADADGNADWSTTLKVKLALLEKLGTDSLRVDVDSEDGKVELTGAVKKRETSELATTVARSVTGVTDVQNDLQVQAGEENPNTVEKAAQELEAEWKDAVLETKVRIAFLDQLGADGFKVGTEAASGVVTLEFGSETSAELRQKAIAAARSVEGVEKVVSVDRKS
jgi:hyperosmotically inducible protein